MTSTPQNYHSSQKSTKGPKKSLGQHWLKNRQILDQIADLATPVVPSANLATPVSLSANLATPVILSAKSSKPADFTHPKTPNSPKSPLNAPLSLTCLEIGPGLGTLTASLLRRFKRVIAVEFDPELAAKLPKSFPGTNLEVIQADILDFDFTSIPSPYVVAGNIPYYITSPIIEKLLTITPIPQKIALLIQKEVAERLASPKESYLSLWVKNRAFVELGSVVSRDEFTPPPKVDSQVVALTPHVPEVSEDVFKLIKIGFSAPRKKLLHNLASVTSRSNLQQIFTELNLNLNARPSDLDLKDWQHLYHFLPYHT